MMYIFEMEFSSSCHQTRFDILQKRRNGTSCHSVKEYVLCIRKLRWIGIQLPENYK